MPSPPRTKYPEYLSIDAVGTVSAFIDRNVVMTDSSGIRHYLVARCGTAKFAVGVDEPEYEKNFNWLPSGDANLAFPKPWCSATPRYSFASAQAARHNRINDAGGKSTHRTIFKSAYSAIDRDKPDRR